MIKRFQAVNSANKMKPGECELVMTTAFINVEEIKWQGDDCIVYDMSGQGRYRESWSFFYPDIDGIIYCIDSSEEECEDRGTINQEILHEIARHPGLARRNIPIAIMANK